MNFDRSGHSHVIFEEYIDVGPNCKPVQGEQTDNMLKGPMLVCHEVDNFSRQGQ